MLRLDAESIQFETGGHKILSGINLSFLAGELVALLGPSGSGKSTLLKALSGFRPVDGRVYLCERSLYDDFEELKTLIAYVPQEDILHQSLSVEETIDFAAQLRLDPRMPETRRRAMVRASMVRMGLEHRASAKIRTLSGGQRKRVSVAVELLAEPPMLFLDEPTSGLDPALEASSMKLFRSLTNKEKITVVTTHVMSSMDSVDLVVFLSRGRIVFLGPPMAACEFFGVDHLIDVYGLLDEKNSREFREQYLKSASYDEFVRARLNQTREPLVRAKNVDSLNKESPTVEGREHSPAARKAETAKDILARIKEERGK